MRCFKAETAQTSVKKMTKIVKNRFFLWESSKELARKTRLWKMKQNEMDSKTNFQKLLGTIKTSLCIFAYRVIVTFHLKQKLNVGWNFENRRIATSQHPHLLVEITDPVKQFKPWQEMWLTLLEILHQLKSIKSLFGCQPRVCSQRQSKRRSHTAIFFVNGAQRGSIVHPTNQFWKRTKSLAR